MNLAKLAQQLNEAAAFHQSGKLDNAEKLYRAVLKQVPKQPDALHLLGVLLDQRGDRAKGISFIRQALAVKSAFPDAHFNLARMLVANGEMDAAKRHYESALSFKPGHARSYNGLGIIHRIQGAYAEAVAVFERAIQFEPKFLHAYINLCNTYRDDIRETEILAVAEKGLAVDPNNAQLWLLKSEAAFTAGDLAEGWRDYEWRFTSPERPVDKQNYALPFWKGEDLTSKSILIWCEQGVGDEIIFASMIAGIAKRAQRCVVQTTPRLAPLFARSFPNVEVIGAVVPDETTSTLDYEIAAGSVGQWTRPSFGAFPVVSSYLHADADQTAALRSKYTAHRPGHLVVGVAWRSAGVVDSDAKSVGLQQWDPILSVPGVTFVNLQYGDNGDEIAAARSAFGADIIEDDEVDSLTDLDSFASQVAAMDLVISSSNSAAHMAGALGVPVFCLVPRALGNGRRWYWFGDGSYAPWYRSMTLFRQKEATWADAVAELGNALSHATAGAAPDTAASPREAAKGKLKQGAAGEALALVDKALQPEPEAADLHNMRGMALARLGRLSEAVEAYTNAVQRAPRQAEIYNNLGTALRRLGRANEASETYAKAHSLKPDHPSIFLNHAMALAEAGKLDESLAALNALVAEKPDFVDAQYNRALGLLSAGQFEDGWKAFPWRLQRPDVHVRHEDFPQPVWKGETLANKHVLIWTDLGLGEEILTSSMVPDAIAAAQRVTLLCSDRMVALLRRSFPDATVDVRKSPLPATALAKDIDLQMSMAELGAAFRPSAASFGARKKFLAADAGLRNALRTKYLASAPSNILVGISWRSVNPEIGAQKSITLTEWLPLLKIPGVTFVNLQYGETREEIESLRRDHGVTIITDPDIDMLGDVDPVAAQIAAMDQVISISNTTVHIAGGLGVPALILLPSGYARLWYWFRAFAQCLWYPQARLLTAEDGADALMSRARAAVWNLKGDTLLARAQPEDATEAYRQAIALEPHHSVYLHDLGRGLLQSGRFAEAQDALRQAVALTPDAWGAWSDLGTAQLEQGRSEAALESFNKAIATQPAASLAHLNRGKTLQELGRLSEAETSYRDALRLVPESLPTLAALAALLGDMGNFEEAEKLFCEARSLNATSPLVNQAYALMKLRFGDLRKGFSAYDARFQAERFSLPIRPFTAPWWQGEDLTGRDILIWTEQGLGDEILSASMFAEVVAAARSCTIECSERAAPLFQRSFTGAKVIARSDPPHPLALGHFDCQTPAFSLAKTLRPDLGAFPKQNGYLHAEAALVERLRQKYRAKSPGALVVGISWDSTARHGTRKRLPLEAWAPILGIPGITFVALQYGVSPDDPAVKRAGLIVDGDVDAKKSLDASAAQVAAMDLVITVSNTTAHLAGSQGVPLWTLLPSGPGCLWYWFRDRGDSPWYPSMRIYRQESPGAWQPVVDAVAQALVETKAQGRL